MIKTKPSKESLIIPEEVVMNQDNIPINPWKTFYESAKDAFPISIWQNNKTPTKYFIRELTYEYVLIEPLNGGMSFVLSKGKVNTAARKLFKYRRKIRCCTLIPSSEEEAAFVHLYPYATWDENGEYIELIK